MHVVHGSWWLVMFCGPSLSDGFILQFCILEAGYKNVITKFVEKTALCSPLERNYNGEHADKDWTGARGR